MDKFFESISWVLYTIYSILYRIHQYILPCRRTCQFMRLGHLQGLNWGPADSTWIYCLSLSFRAKSLKPESVTAWLCSSLTWTKTCNTREPKVYTCRLGATENNYRATASDFYVLQFLSNDWKLALLLQLKIIRFYPWHLFWFSVSHVFTFMK